MGFWQKILPFFWLLAAVPAFADLTPEKLAHELSARVERVPEFEFIRAEAEKLGVKVYLFGGTAASYGHYVREDMLREAGDQRFPAHRFDYDYTNIFRSTQDLDVVVDGSSQEAERLEKILKDKFPHFIGDKGAGWEVRPLRVARGQKEAILGNPNFLNQHTDSHSTGLIEISKPKTGELGVRDVRDWDAPKPQFLKDVAEAKLHYYFNPLHEATKRFKEGKNPPIISVIRYLTKTFQYGLEVRPEDKAKIREIVEAFKPSDINNDYLKHWVEKNGKKLFQHSVNLEKSWDLLEELGLRAKLAAIKSNPRTLDSLSWWMNKAPLRTEKVGQGSGKTAGQLLAQGKLRTLTMAHETNSYLAYESITKDRAGDLNAFISRGRRDGEVPGELAFFGDGFYAKLGRSGARDTGLTIRMELDPLAREKSDFTVHDDYVVIKNKAAVKVLSEQIQISPVEYFRMLAEGKEFSKDDRALLETFKHRVKRSEILKPQEKADLVAYVKEISSRPINKESMAMLREWFSLAESVNHPELIDLMRLNGLKAHNFVNLVLTSPRWENHPLWDTWADRLIASGKVDQEMVAVLSKRPEIIRHPKLPEWLEALVARGKVSGPLARDFLSKPELASRPEFPGWIENILPKLSNSDGAYLFSQPHVVTLPALDQWIEGRIAAKDSWAIKYAFRSPEAAKRPNFSRWMDQLLDFPHDDLFELEKIFYHPHVIKHPDFSRWFEKEVLSPKRISVALNVLEIDEAVDHPEFLKWVREVAKEPNGAVSVITRLLLGDTKAEPAPIVAELIQLGVGRNFLERALEVPRLANDPKLKQMVGPGKAVNYQNLRSALAQGSLITRYLNETSLKCSIFFTKLKRGYEPPGYR